MPMSDYEKLIWDELKEMKNDIKTIKDYMEKEVDKVKDELSDLKTSQAVSKVKLGAIITTFSAILSTAIVSIMRKYL